MHSRNVDVIVLGAGIVGVSAALALQARGRSVAIVDRLAAVGCPLSSDDLLSRPPRGFEAAKGTAVAEYVGWKSVTAHRMLSDAEMQSSALVDRIVDFARTVLPLLEWGWAAVDDEPPPPLPIRKPTRRLPKPDF